MLLGYVPTGEQMLKLITLTPVIDDLMAAP